MATGTKPPKKRKGKGAPPAISIPTKNNLKTVQDDEYVPLNFRVPSTFKKDIKLYALMSNVTMTYILKRGFDLYKKDNPI